ncbi:hypothetical protein [Pseudomonas anguilliseptica]|uniref:hypothetical protein n=1 Tax=Pseudomonas anguilliseptica TaxID=53406 RepID=UPI001428929B|nr:hypothetical protein [Pseudomonas anguilliseptica]
MNQHITCNILKRMFVDFQARASKPLKSSAAKNTQGKIAGGKPSRASGAEHPFVTAI